ncbi:MAG: hypothetical protein GX138_03740 [Firmicutes bacterium]|jgi:hypothetical protein|nr:hypothetical protein [Bacillota bacterium]
MFETIITFPFVQLASGLHHLSLSGNTGNIIAIILYAAFCLLPMSLFMSLWLKHKPSYTDALLPLTTILLFIIMYQLINPALISTVVATTVLPSITIYSLIFTYLILRLIRLFQGKNIERLCQYLNLLLWIIIVLLIYSVISTTAFSFPQSIQILKSANSGNTDGLKATYLFLFLGMIVEIIPMVASIAVVLFSIRLVKQFDKDQYSEETVRYAGKLSSVCKASLIVTVLSTMVFNLLQYAFASQLRQINSNINIPLLSLVFVLAMLILSQIIKASKALKDDSDSII